MNDHAALNFKLIDLSFDAVKFLIGLFVAAFTFYLTLLTVIATILVSTQISTEAIAIMRISGTVFSVLVTGFMWVIVYLVRRAARELFARLVAVSHMEEKARYERAIAKLEATGIVGALGGTVLIIALSFFFLSL